MPLLPASVLRSGRSGVFHLYRNSLRYNYNVGSLRSTITLGYIESNGLAFLQSLEAISHDASEMYEYILASLSVGDKAISLCSVDPLNSTLVHKIEPPITNRNMICLSKCHFDYKKNHMFL